MQADPLLSEPPGKPKNTGTGSLTLLQRIFPTQESNLQHCRQILYQLSYLFGGFALNASTEALWVKCDFSRNLSISSRFFQISYIELCRATSYHFLSFLYLIMFPKEFFCCCCLFGFFFLLFCFYILIRLASGLHTLFFKRTKISMDYFILFLLAASLISSPLCYFASCSYSFPSFLSWRFNSLIIDMCLNL